MGASMHRVKIGQMITRQAITVTPDTPMVEAVAVMAQRRISCLVVVGDERPVGIFTERDLVKCAGYGVSFAGRPIREFMTSPVVTIPGSLSLYEAYNLLLTNGIRHHVVVDRGGKVVGVLSQSAIIEHLGLEYFVELRKIEQIMSRGVVTVAAGRPVREALARMAGGRISCVVAAQGDRPEGILTERDATRLVAAGADLDQLSLAEAMTRPVRTVAAGSTVESAAMTMKRHGIRRVLVVDDSGRIAGIVTQSDVVKGLEVQYVDSLKRSLNNKEDILRETAKELLDKSVYLDGILRSSVDLAIVATDIDYRIKYFNPVAEKLFNYSAEEAIGRSALELHAVRLSVPVRLLKVREIVLKRGEYRFPLKIELEGSPRFYDGRVTGIRDRLNRLAGFVMMLRDVTERRRRQEEIRHLAYHDALTGLPNRVLLVDRIAQALSRAGRNASRCALLMLDLDNFKEINDTLGHGVGDSLLQAVSTRLRELARKSDTVCRMGGDEFVLLLSGCVSREDGDLVAGKILSAFRHPFACAGRPLRVTASIGIAVYPEDGADEETLLRKADIAMYRAKEDGRNAFRRWTAAEPPILGEQKRPATKGRQH